MAISRFILDQWPHIRWYPRWLLGIPFENTYSPLLPFVDAGFAAVTHTSTALAFHAVCAFFYAIGPALLFVFAWRFTGALAASLFGALLYSLYSPSTLVPMIRGDIAGWHHARRLHTIVHYGEGPHNVVLALLPLALLLIYFALTRRTFASHVLAGLAMATLVLFNAFGAMDLAIGIGCLALALEPQFQPRRVLPLLVTALAAYLWISPSLPPSLVHTLYVNSQVVGGDFRGTLQSRMGLTAIVAGVALLYAVAARLRDPFERFVLYFGFVFTAILVLSYALDVSVFPQPQRYHLEFEMAFCLAAVCLARRVLALPWPKVRLALAVLASLFLAGQLYAYHRYARSLIHRIDITATPQYKVAKWLDTNMHGRRAMVSADDGLWFNVFSDNPQISAGHDPYSPNWMAQVAVFAIYNTPNAVDSVLWLKALGAQAITVPGPDSHEEYKPFPQPAKFEGVLPRLWSQDGVQIYGVPQRAPALIHVVPADNIVQHPPATGLDLAEVQRYVNSLEDPAFPVPSIAWLTPASARIQAQAAPGQAVSLQVNYDRGWHASVHGRAVPVHRDGLGLLALYPNCAGSCDIDLQFGWTLERIACWIASLLVTVSVFAVWIRSRLLLHYPR